MRTRGTKVGTPLAARVDPGKAWEGFSSRNGVTPPTIPAPPPGASQRAAAHLPFGRETPARSSRVRFLATAAAPAVLGGDSDVEIIDWQGHSLGYPRTAEPPGIPEDPLGGIVRGIPRHCLQAPRRHADGLPAAVRHDPLARHRAGVRAQGEDHPLPVLHRVRRPPPGRRLRAGSAAHAARQRLQVGGPRLRHRAARACCCTARSAAPRAPSPAC